MSDYIKREEVLNKFRPYEDSLDGIDTTFVLAEIEQLPAAPVVEQKHGEWIDTGFFTSDKTPIFECSVCHMEVYDHYIKWHNFCLHCGADMRGKSNVSN